MPVNWRHTLMVIDLKHPPESVPVIDFSYFFYSLNYISSMIHEDNISIRFFSIIAVPIFFIPAQFYRWSLKSTCWLYLPLLYLFYGKKESEDDGRLLVSLLHDGRMEDLRQLLSVPVVISVLASFFFVDQVKEFHETYQSAPIVLYLWAFDLSMMPPWQWVSLLSAIITGIIFILSDIAHRSWELRKSAASSAGPDPRHTPWLFWSARLRSLCTVLSLVMAFGFVYLALTHTDVHHLHNGLSLLTKIYGPYLPPVLP